MKHYVTLNIIFFASMLHGAETNHYLVDRNISPYAMGDNFLSAYSANLYLQDLAVPPKDPPTRSVAAFFGRLMFGVFAAKIISDPIITFQHEFAGHGYRCRDLGKDKCEVEGYKYRWMLGGATELEFDPEKISLGDLNSITVAGIEAENILARQLKMRWLKNNYIEPRQIPLYETQVALLLYASSLEKADIESDIDFLNGNDLKAFVNTLNLMFPQSKITYGGIRGVSLITLLDPMFWYASAAQLYYLFSGKGFAPPMIPMGPVRYLPNLRTALAPYGVELYLENFFTIHGSPLYFYLKRGSHASHTYGGAGFEYPEAFSTNYGAFGFRGDIFIQPDVFDDVGLEKRFALEENDKEEVTKVTQIKSKKYTDKWGVSGSIIYQTPLFKKTMKGYLELGWKTKGYVPGQSIHAQAITRGGLTFTY